MRYTTYCLYMYLISLLFLWHFLMINTVFWKNCILWNLYKNFVWNILVLKENIFFNSLPPNFVFCYFFFVCFFYVFLFVLSRRYLMSSHFQFKCWKSVELEWKYQKRKIYNYVDPAISDHEMSPRNFKKRGGFE